MWCCAGVFVVLWCFLWWWFCWCGSNCVVVFLCWCGGGGVFVLVFLWWCFCAGVCVVVLVWWYFCGGVFKNRQQRPPKVSLK